MINLLTVRKSILEKGSVIVDIYKNSHFQFKTSIFPFMPDMKNANNIILFVDNENNITGGQIGKYDIKNGLRTILF